ncbi:MAG: Ppx/GppA family phosphatase [Mariprofundus sp.]|nr:Ppx/GppA family phosphatase [Mariprofundus sp.]
MSHKRFAAIDIGSNTFRLLIAEKSTAAAALPWHIVYYTHRIIRLGEGLHQHGKLADNAMQRALVAFTEFSQLVAKYQVSTASTLALATAAMREASNGEAFCASVEAQTGLQIHIIDGNTEARMSLAGASAVLTPSTRQDMLLFDIGGGSSEFIRAANGQCRDAISTKMGVVRLVEAHLQTDPPSATDYQKMVDAADLHLHDVVDSWGDDVSPPQYLVGTAGTVTTLAATQLDLAPYDADKINNHWMDRDSFYALRDRLLTMNHQQRQLIRTIETGRADLIIAGLAIIEAIFIRFHYDGMFIVDAGLLEGGWLEISDCPFKPEQQ